MDKEIPGESTDSLDLSTDNLEMASTQPSVNSAPQNTEDTSIDIPATTELNTPESTLTDSLNTSLIDTTTDSLAESQVINTGSQVFKPTSVSGSQTSSNLSTIVEPGRYSFKKLLRIPSKPHMPTTSSDFGSDTFWISRFANSLKTKKKLLASFSALASVLIIFGIGLIVFNLDKNNNSKSENNSLKDYQTTHVPLSELKVDTSLGSENSQVAINGQLHVNNGLLLAPTAQPTNPIQGQIYLDQKTKSLSYYDGTKFISLGSTVANNTNVTNVNNSTNIINNNNVTEVTNVTNTSVTNVTNATGVLSLQGETGDVQLVAGSGISLQGLTITNAGVTSLAGTSNQISVSQASGSVVISLPQDIANTSSPTFAGLAINGLISATGNINTNGSYLINGVPISSSSLSDISNIAKLDGTGPQTFTGNNSFTGTVLLQNAANSSSAFVVKNASDTSDVLRVDTTATSSGTVYVGGYLDVAQQSFFGDVYVRDGNVLYMDTAGSYYLFQNTPGSITTNAKLRTSNAGGKDTLSLSSTSADTGLTIGGDTNLYRSSANNLKTDDALTVTGNFTNNGSFLHQNATDSANAFQIQNSSGTSQLNLDNTSNTLSLNTQLDLTRSNSTTIGTAVEGQWTMNSNSFTYRRTLTISNQSSSQTLPIGYEITVSLGASDSAQVYANAQGDDDDFRLAHGSTELNRNITSWTSSNIAFTFQVNSGIAASGSDATYYAYYKNADITDPAPTYTPTPSIELDDADDVLQWTSSDAGFVLSQEITIKQEGTGSVKVAAEGQTPTSFSATNQSQLPLPKAVQAHSTVTASVGGTTYVYNLGGYSLGAQSTVYKATIDSSGNIGAWSSADQNQLPQALYYHSTVTASISGTNYIYVIGGHNGTAPQSTVYKATIDSSGNIGTWSTTNQGQLPQALYGHSTTVSAAGTSMVTIGGHNGTTEQSTVYGASINSSGDIVSWSTSGQSQLLSPRAFHTTLAAVVNGVPYIYLLGGTSGGTAQTTVYRAGFSFGVGGWTTSGQTVLPTAHTQHTSFTANVGSTNYIYVVGNYVGSNPSTTVYRSTLSVGGNVGAWSTASQGQLPAARGSHTTVKATIGAATYAYTIGGNAYGLQTTVYKATVDTASSGNVSAWSTANQGQLAGSAYHSTATATVGGTNYIYTTGGYDGASGKSAVYKATVDSSGNIGTWSTTNQGQLPVLLYGHTTVTANIGGTTYIYTIGGYSSGAQLTVYRATIDSSGNVGTWSTTSQGQLPLARYYHTTVTANIGGTNYIYVLGGHNGITPSANVYKATIDSSGNIGTWGTTQNLPQALYEHNTVTASVGGTTYIYTLSGKNSSNAAQTTVYKATVDGSGNIGTWSTTNQGQLVSAVSPTAVIAPTIAGTTYIYTLGGNWCIFGCNTVNYVTRATIDSSGNIGTFDNLLVNDHPQLPGSSQNHTAVSTPSSSGGIYIHVLGGLTTNTFMGTTTFNSNVWKSFIPSTATYQSTKTITPTDLSSNDAIRFDFRSSLTGTYMAFEFSEDGSTWQTYPFSVTDANTWESKVIDISALSTTSRDAITQIRFRVTDASTSFTAYFDDISSPATAYTDAAPLVVSSSHTWGQASLNLNAQGTGAVAVQYSTGGTGGLSVYDGSTTAVFTVSGTGDTLVKTSTDSTTAFRVQNAASTTLLSIDTLGSNAALGTSTGTGTTTIDSGTGGINIGSSTVARSINIGTGAAAQTLNLGNNTDASALNLRTGTGNFTLDGTTSSTYTIGTSTTTGTISIGGTAQSGTLTLGSSSATNAINIGNGAGATTVNISNANTAGAVNIGSGFTSGTISIGGTGLQTGTISLGTGTGAQTINLATGGTGAKTVTLGSTASSSALTLQSGTGAINIGTSASARSINIGTGAAAQTITIGSTTSTSPLTLQSGTSGVLVKGANSTTAFQVQNAGSTTVFDVDTTNSRVGIGTAAPGNLLSIGALTTAASGYQVAVTTGGATNSGIVIQTVAGQSNGNLLQAQDSTGAALATLDYLGNLTVKSATINGALTVNGHIVTGNTSGSTTSAAHANAGTSASCTISGNDTGGQITLVTGSAGWTSGVQCTITFASSYSGAMPNPVITPANGTDNSAVKPYVDVPGSTPFTTWTINFINADTGANTYKFNYFNAQ